MPLNDAMVDATGTRRRVQALVFIGHTREDLAALLGMSALRLAQHLTSGHVPEELAAAVAGLYDELWKVHPAGPSAKKARAAARQHSWVSPLAWDDDPDDGHGIDDPAAVPDLGKETAAASWEILAKNTSEILGWGYNLEHAAARLGVTESYLQTALRRARGAAADEAVAA